MIQETSNNTTTNAKKLSIQISLNGFSFCIINKSTQNIEVILHHPFGAKETPEATLQHLDKELANNSKLQQDFQDIEIIYENDLYTFVPNALFDKKNKAAYLNYTIKTLSTDFISHDKLAQHEMVNVYIPFTNINNYIFERFGAFEYYHLATVLVENLILREKNSEQTIVYGYLNTTNFYLVIIKNGKLLLCNTFIYESKEDFLYYLLFTTEQLKLNPEEFTLFFLGAIDKEHECYKIAYKYIRTIAFTTIRPEDKSTITAVSEPYHKEFIFLNRL